MKARAVVPAAVATFAAGYVAGTRAGRRQAAHLARLAGRAGRSVPVAGAAGMVGDKVAAAGRLTVEWMKDVAGVALGWRNGDEAADAIVEDLADELAHAINEHRPTVPQGDRPDPGTEPAGSSPPVPPSLRRPPYTGTGQPRRTTTQASSR